MKKSLFHYELPEELIAQHPADRRDMSRLMVLDRESGGIEHKVFKDIIEYIAPGDALVINDTKVIPARILGQRADTGGSMELLLLRKLNGDVWEVLAKPAKRAAAGREFDFGDGTLKAFILDEFEEGIRTVVFKYSGVFEEVLDKVGVMPLPPYIHEKPEDPSRYQTVYARHSGSAAAPTAGLHFTNELLGQLQSKGVHVVRVLLHVGLGTFLPVKAENLEDHEMHQEYYEITDEAADILNQVKANGGRIICAGTTSVRTIETVADDKGVIHGGSGETGIFIYPGYRFKAVDAILTNFHLPESTLVMLVSAFAGRENVLNAYRTAVDMRYRFFSFGDAMFIR